MARTTRVVLLTGDYADRLNHLYEAAVEAKQDASSPLFGGEEDPVAALRAEYDALKAEAEAEGIVVEMTAIGRSEWRKLREQHPMRTEGDSEVVKGDQIAGVNSDTVEDDLVFKSVTSPAFKSRAAFDEWADDLSEGEWQALVARAWELANGARLDPKSLPVWPTRSTETS